MVSDFLVGGLLPVVVAVVFCEPGIEFGELTEVVVVVVETGCPIFVGV